MSWELDQYSALIDKILSEGKIKETRNGNTVSIFGEKLVIDMKKSGFPLLNGRRLYYKPVIGELAAFLKGPKHIQDFKNHGCNYWDDWADEQGKINVDYGNKWRDFGGVDQLQKLVDTIKNDPNNRRMLISGWDPSNIDKLSLPCCHMLYQWYVSDGTLDMIWYQRSVDVMVGLPSDIILAAVWNMLLANECNLKPGKLTFMLGDTHIYTNHLEGVLRYKQNLHKEATYNRPFAVLDNNATVFNFTPDMLAVHFYSPMPPIKFKLNV